MKEKNCFPSEGLCWRVTTDSFQGSFDTCLQQLGNCDTLLYRVYNVTSTLRVSTVTLLFPLCQLRRPWFFMNYDMEQRPAVCNGLMHARVCARM